MKQNYNKHEIKNETHERMIERTIVCKINKKKKNNNKSETLAE